MNTVDLDQLTSRYVKRFAGVFSSDRLPSNPRMLVSNIHPSNKPGEHWVATMEITENSLTHLAVLLPMTNSYMNKHCSRWTSVAESH